MSHIFISYSRKDIDFAQKIVDALATNDLDTWVDWKSIPKGEDWEQEIYRGIEEADVFLFLISTDSVVSKPCNLEIAHAVKNGKRILPVFIADVEKKDVYNVTGKFINKESKEEIDRRNFIFYRKKKDDFNKAIAEIYETIQTDYAWLQYHRTLQVKAVAWEKNNEDPDRLLRGNELDKAEKDLARDNLDPKPTELQRQFLLTSRQNQVRRQRRILSLSLAALAISIFLGSLVFINGQKATDNANSYATQVVLEEYARATAEAETKRAEKQTKLAQSGNLAAIARNKMEDEHDLALLLSLESMWKADNFFSRDSLLANVEHNPYLLHYLQGQGGYIESMAFSPDGKILASGSSDGTIHLWDTQTGQQIGEALNGDKWIFSIVFSSDGKLLASSGIVDNAIRLWDVQTGRQIWKDELSGYGMWAGSISFSPDEKRLINWSASGDIFVFDIATGRRLRVYLLDDEEWSGSVAFSPDRQVLARWNADNLITLWDWETREKIGEIQSNHTDNILVQMEKC